MNTKIGLKAKGQAGFTLVELIVVIVILGILAATAVPRMFDMSSQARLAKMQALAGALKASMATTHSAWMAGGGVLGCTACATGGGAQTATVVSTEGITVPTIGGYPDVGGDGFTNTATADESAAATSGIVMAAGLVNTDYVWTTKVSGTATKDTLTFSPDASHPNCTVVYKEAVQTNPAAGTQPTTTAAPTVTVNATASNC